MRNACTLTPKGKDLGDVLFAFVRLGKRHFPGTVVMGKTPAKGAPATRKPTQRRAKSKRGRQASDIGVTAKRRSLE